MVSFRTIATDTLSSGSGKRGLDLDPRPVLIFDLFASRERIRDKYNTSADASAFCRMIRTIEMAKGSGKGQGSGAGSGGGGGSIIKVAKNATANGRDQITIVGPTDGEGSAVAMLGGGGDGPDSGHESITYIVTTSQRSAVNSKDDDQMITAHTSINPSSWGIHQ